MFQAHKLRFVDSGEIIEYQFVVFARFKLNLDW